MKPKSIRLVKDDPIGSFNLPWKTNLKLLEILSDGISIFDTCSRRPSYRRRDLTISIFAAYVLHQSVDGAGQDLRGFRIKIAQMAGRLVLQDMAEAITQIPKSSTGVEATVQDIFNAQPIKGK